MTAYNIVRLRVKPGRQQEFETMDLTPPSSVRRAVMVKTGDTTYCFIGEWDTYKDIIAARATMIGNLDSFREFLADLGGGLGVTYPVSGSAVFEFEPKGASERSPSSRPAYSIARYRAKSGRDQEFVAAVTQHVNRSDFEGLRKAVLVDVGSRGFVFLSEWDSKAHLARSGPSIVGAIDANRHLLEDAGSSAGAHVASGEVIVEF